ncbi:MAG: hypothetical protein R3C16_08020 [Hyphomonadaceae bacterium]
MRTSRSTAARRVLEQSSYRIHVEDFGPANRILAARQDDAGHLLYAVDADTGAQTPLAQLEQPVRQAFIAGGRVLFTTNAWSNQIALYALPLNGGEPRHVLGFSWDIEDIVPRPIAASWR